MRTTVVAVARTCLSLGMHLNRFILCLGRLLFGMPRLLKERAFAAGHAKKRPAYSQA
jgi:hypothetical protein